MKPEISYTALALAIATVLAIPKPAYAMYTYSDLKSALEDIDKASKAGKQGEDSEKILRAAAKVMYNKDHPGAEIAETRINGVWPAVYAAGDLGNFVTVTFDFYNSDTGVVTPPPIAISEIVYEALLDPGDGAYTPIGSSSDLASNFAIPFVLTGFEPIIQGIPIGLNGLPYPMDGNWGISMDILVPEPTTALLLAPAFAGLWLSRRRPSREIADVVLEK